MPPTSTGLTQLLADKPCEVLIREVSEVVGRTLGRSVLIYSKAFRPTLDTGLFTAICSHLLHSTHTRFQPTHPWRRLLLLLKPRTLLPGSRALFPMMTASKKFLRCPIEGDAAMNTIHESLLCPYCIVTIHEIFSALLLFPHKAYCILVPVVVRWLLLLRPFICSQTPHETVFRHEFAIGTHASNGGSSFPASLTPNLLSMVHAGPSVAPWNRNCDHAALSGTYNAVVGDNPQPSKISATPVVNPASGAALA